MIRKTLNLKQREFCRLVVQGLTQTDAYVQAFGTKNRSSASTCSSMLMIMPLVQDGIKQYQEELAQIVALANQATANNIADGSIASATERMKILTKIIRGEMIIVQEALFEGIAYPYVTKPTFSEIKAAINELNRMDGSHKPIEANVRVIQEQPLFPDANIINIDNPPLLHMK
jgi:hypothetical protein